MRVRAMSDDLVVNWSCGVTSGWSALMCNCDPRTGLGDRSLLKLSLPVIGHLAVDRNVCLSSEPYGG